MTPFEPGIGQLRHLEYGREPDREPRRRKPGSKFPREKPPVPNSRAEHGQAISHVIGSAVDASASARESVGIDPFRLLVLEFRSVNLDLRTLFEERFHASVVDEETVLEGKTQRHRCLVQFPDRQAVESFLNELDLYIRERDRPHLLTCAKRRDLFDSIESAARPSREDRIGSRLRQEGYPASEKFFFDVDIWHPGSNEGALSLQQEVRQIADRFGGQITSTVKTASLLLMTVHGPVELAEALLDLDFVARLDLPTVLADAYTTVAIHSDQSAPKIVPSTDEPMVCVIDSGVVAGHPLLTGWVVEERDFDTGEGTASDLNGHGTAVAGLVVYGDIAQAVETNQWNPRVRICSAKILRHDSTSGNAVLPDGHRLEELVDRAIRYFHGERNCRIFNLSVGSWYDIYSGGRQFGLAELIDHLVRELNIVVIVPTGNRLLGDLPVPECVTTRDQFHEEVRKQMLHHDQRLTNPGTAALALTVGSVARSDATHHPINFSPPPPLRDALPGSPPGKPSPFSRVGPGYAVDSSKLGIKPDVVQYGGNCALQTIAGGNPRWADNHLLLGEPTIQSVKNGRYLCTRSGTSFACPKVSNAAAVASASLENVFGRQPTANAIRALVGSAARTREDDRQWLGGEGNSLRFLGYGMCEIDKVAWSSPNRVVLVAEDSIGVDRFHIYQIPVPRAFLLSPGRRGLTVSLAFSPPVRSSRKKYLARTMSFDVFQGLSTDEVERFRSHHPGTTPPKAPDSARLDFRPPTTKCQWSTLQVRTREWKNAPKFQKSDGADTSVLHLVVTCRQEFPTGMDDRQWYGLSVVFWHENATINIYEELQNHARVRAARLRTRG